MVSMSNRVYLNSDGIIEIEVIGDQTVPSVEAMGRQTDSFITQLKAVGKPCLILDNLLQIGKVGPEARREVVDVASRLDFDRAAMLGQGGMMRFGANLMLRATGRAYKMRYFDRREDAVKWLLDEDEE